MDRLHLKFYGRNISDHLCSEVRGQLGLALGRTPKDARLCCCIANEKEGFSANLKIHSSLGQLFIHRESKSLHQLMVFLLRGLRESLAQWQTEPNEAMASLPIQSPRCRGASHKKVPCKSSTLKT